MSSAYNFPLVSIPIYYALAIAAHGQAILIANKGDPRRHDNRNPKSSELQAKLKAKLSSKDFARWERAESCHRNHLENMPLYVASILVSLFVERQTGVKLQTSWYAGAFLGVRVLYTMNYLTTETQIWSYARSALYFVGVGLCFSMLLRAAKALGPEE